MSETAATSTLAQALESGRRVVTAELVTAGTQDADAVRTLAAAFPSSLDALVVSSGGEPAISAVISSTLLAALGVEPVLALLTRDRNRTALLADAAGAGAMGVRNILCLPGEHQTLGAQPEAAGVYDVDPVQLIQLLAGSLTGAPFSLFIGAEAYPHLRPLELSLIDARKKAKAGARFLLTSPIFDAASFIEWLDAARQEKIDEEVAIIATVQPLTDVAQAEALQRRGRVPEAVVARLRNATDTVAEGIAICAETASKLAGLEGVRGVHIAWGGTAGVAAEVISRAGLAGSGGKGIS
ncbi:MAG: methylenetetrahydrofolate reductase [Dehalococcoidia bacterium]|jgi:methylenetetrahydrofolate reductase (NADPH)